MKSTNLVLISGPAASGKTTLKNKLLDYFHACSLRPSDAYIMLAKLRNLPIEQTFSLIKRCEAEAFFCKLCKEHAWVIGDQHLAIQFHRDSQMAVSSQDTRDIDEEYSPAISKEFITLLRNENINVFILLLKSNPQKLLSRAQNRFLEIGHVVRNLTESEVKKEVDAEISFFKKLIAETSVDHCVIDTTDTTNEEVYAYALQKLQEFARTAQS